MTPRTRGAEPSADEAKDEGAAEAPAETSSAALTRALARDKARRERARREPVGNLWRQVARVGTLGWMIVAPIVLGAVVGHLIDVRMGTGVTWALALIMLGVATGGYSLWRVLEENHDHGHDGGGRP